MGKGQAIRKALRNPIVRKALLHTGLTAGGAAAGGGIGYNVTPGLFGYSDVPEARRVSATSDAVTGAILANMLATPGGRQQAKKLGLLAPLVAEIPPNIIANMQRERDLTGQRMAVTEREVDAARLNADTARLSGEAASAQAESARRIADATEAAGIPANLGRFMKSSPVRGATGGAAAAGMLSLLTGLTRSKNEKEIEEQRPRSRMVGSDFMKYLLPGLVAGGVMGSLKQPKPTP